MVGAIALANLATFSLHKRSDKLNNLEERRAM